MMLVHLTHVVYPFYLLLYGYQKIVKVTQLANPPCAITPLGHLLEICTIIRIKVLKVIVFLAHLLDRKNANAITIEGGFLLWSVVLALWDGRFGCNAPNFQHQMLYTRISTWC